VALLQGAGRQREPRHRCHLVCHRRDQPPGRVLGRAVQAVVEDGASDPATFAQKAQKLVGQGRVCTVFGCSISASRKTVRRIFEKHNHLVFYPVQYEGLEQSPNIVYTGAAPNQQIIPAVRWSCAFQKKKRLFLVGSDRVFPHAANAIIRDQARDLGVEIVGEKYMPLGSACQFSSLRARSRFWLRKCSLGRLAWSR